MANTPEKKEQQALGVADRVRKIHEERSQFKRMILDILLKDTSAKTLIQWLLNTMTQKERYDLLSTLYVQCTREYFSSDKQRPIG